MDLPFPLSPFSPPITRPRAQAQLVLSTIRLNTNKYILRTLVEPKVYLSNLLCCPPWYHLMACRVFNFLKGNLNLEIPTLLKHKGYGQDKALYCFATMGAMISLPVLGRPLHKRKFVTPTI